jgi:hypothetical protein
MTMKKNIFVCLDFTNYVQINVSLPSTSEIFRLQRLSVPQNLLFRYSLPMRFLGLYVYETPTKK